MNILPTSEPSPLRSRGAGALGVRQSGVSRQHLGTDDIRWGTGSLVIFAPRNAADSSVSSTRSAVRRNLASRSTAAHSARRGKEVRCQLFFRPKLGIPSVTRHFDITNSSRANERSMDLGRVDEVVEPVSTEVWEVRHMNGHVHGFHASGVQYPGWGTEEPAHRPPPQIRCTSPPDRLVLL
jgi:hypothetical protein